MLVKPYRRSSWSAFIRLWFVMFFSYSVLKFAFNLAVLGWIDMRPSFALELLLVPLGQSIVFWFVTRRARKADSAAALPAAGQGGAA